MLYAYLWHVLDEDVSPFDILSTNLLPMATVEHNDC